MLILRSSEQIMESSISTSHGTSTNATSFDLLFYTSFSTNVCVVVYFLLFYIVNQFVVCTDSSTDRHDRLTGKIRQAHRQAKFRLFMHNVYFDCFIHTTLLCCTTVLILTTQAMSTPFQANCSPSLQILNAFITGVYIFLFFKEFIIELNGPNKWMNIIIYGVTMSSMATVVVTREDIVLVAILVLSNGDILNVHAARVMKKILGRRGTSSYRVAIFMGTYATVVFRALLPIGLIVLGLINGKPFNMSYPSVFFFFVGLLFFGALNTWQVNAALARICRKGTGRVIEVQSREVHALPKPEDRQIQERIELPPAYDEVCGEAGLATYTTESEDRSSIKSNDDSDSAAKSDSTSVTTMGSDCTGADASAVLPMTETVSFKRQDSRQSEYTNEGYEEDKEKDLGTATQDDFVEIDLGLPSEV